MDRPGSEEAGNPWARWEYTPEEWQVFDHRDWDGAVRMFVRSILEKMVSLLRPGGVLAVLGLFREASLTDRGVALIAVPVNVFYALSRGSSSSGAPAPTRPADMSLREIREKVSSNLPNARLQRLLLWRYLLTWQKL